MGVVVYNNRIYVTLNSVHTKVLCTEVDALVTTWSNSSVVASIVTLVCHLCRDEKASMPNTSSICRAVVI